MIKLILPLALFIATVQSYSQSATPFDIGSLYNYEELEGWPTGKVYPNIGGNQITSNSVPLSKMDTNTQAVFRQMTNDIPLKADAAATAAALATKFTTPAGSTSQYVRGDGTLATMPTVFNGSNGVMVIDTITTLTAGSTAIASNNLVGPTNLVKLWIPRGDPGATGGTGAPGSPGAPGANGSNAISVNATNLPGHTSGLWYSNNSDYTIVMRTKVIMTPALIGGSIEVHGWTTPSIPNIVSRRTNDWCSAPSLLALLVPPAKGSITVDVPPHWCFCITNAAITGIGNNAAVAPQDSVYYYLP